MPNPRYFLKKKIVEVLKRNEEVTFYGDIAEQIIDVLPISDATGDLAMMQDRVDSLAIAVRKLTQDSSVRPLLEDVSERLENLIIVIDAYNAEEVGFYNKEEDAN